MKILGYGLSILGLVLIITSASINHFFPDIELKKEMLDSDKGKELFISEIKARESKQSLEFFGFLAGYFFLFLGFFIEGSRRLKSIEKHIEMTSNKSLNLTPKSGAN